MVADLSLFPLHGSPAAGPGVMAAINGNSGAAAVFNPPCFFRRRRIDQKKMLVVPERGEGIHLLDEPVHFRSLTPYTPLDQIPL
jgi:hypothetical protein